MIAGRIFQLVKPGALYKVRASCSFGLNQPSYDVKDIYSESNKLAFLHEGTVLLLLEARYFFSDWAQLRGQQIIVFSFLWEQSEVYFPITASFDNEHDFNELVMAHFGLFLEAV